MAYVSHAQLAERPGAAELAQVTSKQHEPLLPDELMELTLTGGQRTGWTPEQIEQADAALARIDDAVADADGLIDGFLRQRGYPLPLTKEHRLVTVWSRAITRYQLHQHRLSTEKDDPIVRDYKEALKQLQQLVEGKISLDIDDELATTAGMPRTGKRCDAIRQALRDY